ncbi:type II toxin-antitoxin system RelE/ParE family toxin [Desulfocurvibacter africanus]|uniref:Plasmid maintenance system killer n=1 Tax=Desulfocurvibacter africanus subsp. africanus str. Walvis Bay TaxID=690850 RepID=F3YXH2_DESAF|nr:type II toxin-antitoxin system RelE/ParE family toxin [Desulfocurvibacter africanus]EGJ51749.1 plasmid maintenance system killer [Desulfocurvibacter africanus subsp. africanus str. Walvis Bay]
MIKSFRCKQTERLFNRQPAKGFLHGIERVAYRKLLMVDAAAELLDLRSPPGNKLEVLSGDREGQHSIRVNDQFRVCFRWAGNDAHDVEIVDYH